MKNLLLKYEERTKVFGNPNHLYSPTVDIKETRITLLSLFWSCKILLKTD